jgi:heme A synthase
MPQPTATRPHLEKRLRVAALLIVVGLMVESATLYSGHPLAFVAYLLFGCSLVAAGVLTYLWAVIPKST